MKIVLLWIFTMAFLLASTIDLEILNIQKTGKIYIGLYNKSQNFTSLEDNYKRKIIQPDSKNMHIKFENIPDGKYAISLFQDENNNHKLDKNFFGVPKEGYGFSNNPKTLTEPTFNDAEFEVKGNTQLHVKVCY